MTKYIFLAAAGALALAAATPTFNKDIAPLLQDHCQECHRPGEIGPFPLLTYKQVRPQAAAIRNAVLKKTMPPWHADPHYGKFKNDASLSQHDIETIVQWASNGAPEGDPQDLPQPRTFTTGWGIPKPDVIFQLPKPFAIPATGTVDYLHWLVPSGFKQDTWIQFAEARPGDRAHVHHVIAYVREPGSTWLKDIKPGVPYVEPKPDPKANVDTAALPSDFLVGYAPGQPPEAFEPGKAKLVKAGSDIIIQVHYTTDGKASTDTTRIGLVFAKEPPRQRVMTFSAVNGKFKIPAGAPNHRVDAEFELGADVVLHGLHPHMHARGKDMIYHVRYPDGRRETLLSVPKYSFTWQLWYNLEKPIALPKGTVIEVTAHFDNSPNNKYNPDPTKDVSWGDQSWDEMMVGFFNFAFDAALDVRKIPAPPRKAGL
jgi:hypothetical protein